MARKAPAQIIVRFSQELQSAIDAACEPRRRTADMEAWLWKVPAIREAAEKIGVTKPVRPGLGRPKAETSEEK